jgi:hypothetical protein
VARRGARAAAPSALRCVPLQAVRSLSKASNAHCRGLAGLVDGVNQLAVAATPNFVLVRLLEAQRACLRSARAPQRLEPTGHCRALTLGMRRAGRC